MKLIFDPNQDFQLEAIAAVTDLFEGQDAALPVPQDLGPEGLQVQENSLRLNADELLDNLHAVQVRNELQPDMFLDTIREKIPWNGETKDVEFANFSVEMETGTGKTYVYLRTALELSIRYGFRKFIIVVPSLAIKEGVLKTLRITQEHFRALYDSPNYGFYEYDSSNLAQVRAFAEEQSMQMMVMTLASFNKDLNVIRQPTDRLQGRTPLSFIQASRPILILDEPQNMESRRSRSALASLNPLLALRYSATHRQVYNLVYQLTPYDAYRRGLVKQIEVAGFEQVDDVNVPYVRLDGITTQKETIRARLTVHKLLRSGRVATKQVTVKLGDNLADAANRAEYGDFTVDEINPGGGYVLFSNGSELGTGDEIGPDKEAMWEAQIRYTIEEHLRKARRLRSRGIKVLSLFFIDRVANYAGPDPTIRTIFNRVFRSAVQSDFAMECWGDPAIAPEAVQGAYFANRTTREGETVLEDSKTGEAQLDEEVYDLIMRDKERLLSLDEPISFIFSHSALREGWDNPNVFQICTLNQTASDMKKRQEIGRGVRLCVDQDGRRSHDRATNILTVAANESYEEYVAQLQTEFEEEYGTGAARPEISNARDRKASVLNKGRILSDEFRDLWERIKHKTRYSVTVDTPRLIREVTDAIDRADLAPPRIEVTKSQVEVADDDSFYALQVSGAKTLLEIAGKYPLPNLVALMEDLLQRTSPPIRLSRRTLREVYVKCPRAVVALDNPYEWARVAVQEIRRCLQRQFIDGIKYERINEWYEMTQFADEMPAFTEHLVAARNSLYDHVICDSDQEREFVRLLESRADVKLYVKLPAWFTVDTPIGTYNPDWAILMEQTDTHGESTGERLYLVRETKGTNDEKDLRADERDKIHCGRVHFTEALAVDFEWGTPESLLP